MERLLRATENSWRGLQRAARTEPAVWQELWLIGLGIIIARLVAVDLAEWVWLVAPLLLVLVIEIINTAIEKLCDRLVPHHDDAIGYVKDLGSAAVFVALLITGLIWMPVILRS